MCFSCFDDLKAGEEKRGVIMFRKKIGRKTTQIFLVFLIAALVLSACGSAAPAAEPSTFSSTQAFEQPVEDDSEVIAIYWDEETQQIFDMTVKLFQNQNQNSGLTPEELKAYYIAHNPVNFVEMSSDQKALLASAGGLVLVGSTTSGGTLTIGSTTVATFEAGSSAIPLLETLSPALQLSLPVMVVVGSGIALKYTTTQAYANKMALMQHPMPENVKILVPTFVEAMTFSTMQTYLPAETYASIVALEGVMGQSLTTSQLTSTIDITWLAASYEKIINLGVATLTISANSCKVDLNLDFKGERFSVTEQGEKGCDPAAQLFFAVAKLIEKFAARIFQVVTAKSFVDALAAQNPQAMQFKLEAQETIFALQSVLSVLLKEMIKDGFFKF